MFRANYHYFGELAEALLKRLISLARLYNTNRVESVTLIPISALREQKETDVPEVDNEGLFVANQKVPVNLDDFLAVGSNKEALVRFLYKHWPTVNLEVNMTVVIAFDKVCVQIMYVYTPKTTRLNNTNLMTCHATMKRLTHGFFSIRHRDRWSCCHGQMSERRCVCHCPSSCR